MPEIFQTKDFVVEAHDKPHHSRENGGHVVIRPKQKFEHRYLMPLEMAADLMHLTQVLGEAMTNALRQLGHDVIRINYQDNGNWAYKPMYNLQPAMHIHLYVRTKNEKHPDNDPMFQAFPEALIFPPRESGYYDKFTPLNREECAAIKAEFERLLASDKYKELSEKLHLISPQEK